MTVEVPNETPEGGKISTVLDQTEEFLSAAERDHDSVAIAINWESNDPTCDLDLYVKSAGEREELCFLKKKSAFGELYRDVRRSGSIQGENVDFQNWEWCTIHHSELDKLEAWLNVYRTNHSATTLRVIRVWKGDRKEQTLQLRATHGNKGGDGFHRQGNPA